MNGKTTIGWIGLGRMGTPMALNLVKAGFPVTVYNRTAEKTRPLVAAGARAGKSIAAAAAADVVISMIADDGALETVALAPGGVLESAGAGAIFVDMSTVSPDASAKVAEAAAARDVHYLRAPVSGSTHHAENALLTIYASGPRAAYQACASIFDTLGKTRFHVGAGEEARVVKLAINLMVGTMAAMMSEAIVLAEAHGIAVGQMVDLIAASVVASPFVGYKSRPLKERDFTAAFTAAQMAKDFDLILAAARAVHAPVPLAAQVRESWSAMIGTGKGDLDYIGLITLFEELAGLDGAAGGDKR